MDKNAIKKFAVWARRELIARVSQKAEQYGITEKNTGDTKDESVNGHLLTQSEQAQRVALIYRIRQDGYQQVMEEVAYTWFNRFCALRFMEVNNYLPTRIRVFTDEDNAFKPQILAEAIHMEMDGLNMDKVYQLKSDNKTEELYKYLLITQCNALYSILPGMFQQIADYTELLLPDNLLREGSVIEQMIALIPEADWTDQVQIIGWLYQYYNSEPKDELINARKQYSEDDVPYVTQLFTSDWIVRFMVENSLGRLWYEGHAESELKQHWDYFLENTPNNLGENILEKYKTLAPENLTCFDPCMGSGHILVYAFDVLMQIYRSYGFSSNEAVESIITKNLFGTDIDERATQLAYFAIMMKARQYDRRFFTRQLQPNLHTVVSAKSFDRYALEYFYNNDQRIMKNTERILDTFKDAQLFGSLVTPEGIDFALINRRLVEVEKDIHVFREVILDNLKPIIQVAELLSKKYVLVITNPPYMATKYMPDKLRTYVLHNYPDLKADLFAVFMQRCSELCEDFGQMGFLTPYVWMFIQSYEKMREHIFSQMTISSLVQLEYNAFEAACVPVASFTLRNYVTDAPFECIKLSDFKGSENQAPRTLEAIHDRNCSYRFTAYQENFSRIPGSPVAYWVSQAMFDTFLHPSVQNLCAQKTRISTGDNDRFMRKWYEVEYSKMQYPNKWVPCPKGGDYRKWYGNIDLVLNWENDGAELKAFPKAMLGDKRFFLKPGITWTVISSTKTGFRLVPAGCICDHKGPLIYVDDETYTHRIMGLLNSKFSEELLKVTAPTIGFEWGAIAKTPWYGSSIYDQSIETMVQECIDISKEDWDSFETSWDFKEHPFVKYSRLIKDADYINTLKKEQSVAIVDAKSPIELCYLLWQDECTSRFMRLKCNEEHLNSYYIDIYGLDGELTPEIDDRDVTVRKADLARDIRGFISYAVGCMFGRYSLDTPGIIYAGGQWDAEKYVTCPADKDGIIPICDDEYFDDDIVGRFEKFIGTVFGINHLNENLQFIASALGGKGNPRDVIRTYFLNDFYADHLRIYQKRPIYWQFDSGKKNGFKCLIYMHRYASDMVARIRTDYVHEQQSRYRTVINDLNNRITNAATNERVRLTKQLNKLIAQAEEARLFEEKVHHLADKMLTLDFDNGVVNNYALFQEVVTRIK